MISIEFIILKETVICLNENFNWYEEGSFSAIAREDFYRRYEDYGFKIILDKKEIG